MSQKAKKMGSMLIAEIKLMDVSLRKAKWYNKWQQFFLKLVPSLSSRFMVQTESNGRFLSNPPSVNFSPLMSIFCNTNGSAADAIEALITLI